MSTEGGRKMSAEGGGANVQDWMDDVSSFIEEPAPKMQHTQGS